MTTQNMWPKYTWKSYLFIQLSLRIYTACVDFTSCICLSETWIRKNVFFSYKMCIDCLTFRDRKVRRGEPASQILSAVFADFRNFEWLCEQVEHQRNET